jgi:riboflavin synthase alpha subunit
MRAASYDVRETDPFAAQQTFGALRPGARLNLEVDQMARYAARLLESMPHAR